MKICKYVQLDNPKIVEQDAHDIRRFLAEFRSKLFETKTEKALIRMIFESL